MGTSRTRRLPTMGRRGPCLPDGGVGGQGGRRIEGVGGRGMEGMRGGREEKTGERGAESPGRGRAAAVADQRVGKTVASGAASTTTMETGDEGEDSRKFREWRDTEGGGQSVLGMPGMGGAMPTTRVSSNFFSWCSQSLLRTILAQGDHACSVCPQNENAQQQKKD